MIATVLKAIQSATTTLIHLGIAILVMIAFIGIAVATIGGSFFLVSGVLGPVVATLLGVGALVPVYALVLHLEKRRGTARERRQIATWRRADQEEDRRRILRVKLERGLESGHSAYGSASPYLVLSPEEVEELVGLSSPAERPAIRVMHGHAERVAYVTAHLADITDAALAEQVAPLDPARAGDLRRRVAATRQRREDERHAALAAEQQRQLQGTWARWASPPQSATGAAGSATGDASPVTDPTVEVYAAHTVLTQALRPVIYDRFARRYGASWRAEFDRAWQPGGARDGAEPDLSALMHLLDHRVVSEGIVPSEGDVRGLAAQIRRDRNRVAHHEPLSATDAYRAIERVEEMMTAVGVSNGALGERKKLLSAHMRRLLS
jgi:hypothetical protein